MHIADAGWPAFFPEPLQVGWNLLTTGADIYRFDKFPLSLPTACPTIYWPTATTSDNNNRKTE